MSDGHLASRTAYLMKELIYHSRILQSYLGFKLIIVVLPCCKTHRSEHSVEPHYVSCEIIFLQPAVVVHKHHTVASLLCNKPK